MNRAWLMAGFGIVALQKNVLVGDETSPCWVR